MQWAKTRDVCLVISSVLRTLDRWPLGSFCPVDKHSRLIVRLYALRKHYFLRWRGSLTSFHLHYEMFIVAVFPTGFYLEMTAVSHLPQNKETHFTVTKCDESLRLRVVCEQKSKRDARQWQITVTALLADQPASLRDLSATLYNVTLIAKPARVWCDSLDAVRMRDILGSAESTRDEVTCTFSGFRAEGIQARWRRPHSAGPSGISIYRTRQSSG